MVIYVVAWGGLVWLLCSFVWKRNSFVCTRNSFVSGLDSLRELIRMVLVVVLFFYAVTHWVCVTRRIALCVQVSSGIKFCSVACSEICPRLGADHFDVTAIDSASGSCILFAL